MGRRRTWGYVPGQGSLSLEVSPLAIHTRSYDLTQAKEAASYRRQRKRQIQKLEPPSGQRKDYDKGFNKRVNGLWVPHSGTESTAVVKIPEDYALQNRIMIRDKVIEKYQDDEEVSERKARRFAAFAGYQALKGLRKKYRGYIINAEEGYRWINDGLGADGEIDRDRVEASKYAYQGLAEYIVYTRTLMGTHEVLGKKLEITDDPFAPRRRLWPQDRWKNVWAGRLAIARTYLDTAPTKDFDRAVFEAYYSERSRHEYWKTVKEDYEDYLVIAGRNDNRKQAHRHPSRDEIMLDPHNDDANYVDGEFIGYE